LTQIGCGTCENKSLLQVDIPKLLDPLKKQSITTGCKSCDKELMTLDIASELEKLNVFQYPVQNFLLVGQNN